MKTGQVNAVVCWDTTRLYRSMKDLERFIEIADAARIPIKTVHAGGLDLSSRAGARGFQHAARRGLRCPPTS